ncbi:MAG: RNB domain-containing ribonuclease, partial [Peptococcaceae bacterium]|nr:RNB domain-containing ribonuclease [Peptococcaceae bacterium]
NETVAAYFFRRKLPFIYRVHEELESEKVGTFLQYIQRLGIYLPQNNEPVTAKTLQWILEKAREKDCEDIVSMMMLRMMNHAYYTTKKTTHFGLASRHYTHFTSPIRRYSDLSIHRVIKEFLQHNRRLNEHRILHYEKVLADASEQASSCERNAEEAERASVDMKKAEYMVDFVGKDFVGKIVSVTSFGFFVELDNTVDGLVHISSLIDDYYSYDEERICLIGEHTGRVFQLGQQVEVVLQNVNLRESQIDFVLKDQADRPKRAKKPAAKKQASAKQASSKKPSQQKAKRLPQGTSEQKKTAPKKGPKRNKKRRFERGPKTNSRKPKSKA